MFGCFSTLQRGVLVQRAARRVVAAVVVTLACPFKRAARHLSTLESPGAQTSFNNASSLTTSQMFQLLHDVRTGATKSYSTETWLVPHIVKHLDEHTELFTPSTLCFAFKTLKYCSSINRGHRSVLQALTRQLVRLPADVQFSRKELCDALGGLRSYSSSCFDTQHAFKCFAVRLATCSNDILSPENLADAMIGFRRSNLTEFGSSDAIEALMPSIQRASAMGIALDSKSMGKCLKGLSSSTPSESVRSLLKVFVPLIEQCTDHVGSGSASNALSGLRLQSSECAIVRATLLALMPKIDGSSDAWSPKSLYNAFKGLQNCSCKNVEVRLVIAALTHKVATNEVELQPNDVCSIISSLRFCTSDTLEVRNLLRALVARVTFDRASVLNAGDLIELFVGLRHFSPEHVEVRSVVSALLPSISKFFENMRNQPDVCASVLRQLNAHAFVCDSSHAEIKALQAVFQLARA